MSVAFRVYWENPHEINVDPDVYNIEYILPLGGVIIPTDTSLDARWGEIDGNINDQIDLTEKLNTKANTDDLSDVAISGNYNDLDNTPTNVSEFTNDSGYLISSDIDNKVDKEIGKGLSTNDFTDQDKEKLDGLENVNLTEGDNITITGTYPDLTISSGGSGGGDLTNYYTKPEVDALPVSTFDNDAGYLDTHQDISGKADISQINTLTADLNTANNTINNLNYKVNTNRSSFIGYGAGGSTNNAVALGSFTEAKAAESIAIGNNAAITNSSSVRGIAIGAYSKAYAYSVALGYYANAVWATNSVALGYQAAPSGDNQVQLGNSSTTTYAYGVIQDRSDIRDKTDIQTTDLGLDFINALRPVKYRWDYREDYYNALPDDEKSEEARAAFFANPVKDGSKTRQRYHHGLIAQEFKQTLDNLGIDHAAYQDHSQNGGLDVRSIGYTELIPNLIKAVQELSQEINTLKQFNS